MNLLRGIEEREPASLQGLRRSDQKSLIWKGMKPLSLWWIPISREQRYFPERESVCWQAMRLEAMKRQGREQI